MWGWCWNCVALPTIKATCLRKPQHVFHKPSGMGSAVEQQAASSRERAALQTSIFQACSALFSLSHTIFFPLPPSLALALALSYSLLHTIYNVTRCVTLLSHCSHCAALSFLGVILLAEWKWLERCNIYPTNAVTSSSYKKI